MDRFRALAERLRRIPPAWRGILRAVAVYTPAIWLACVPRGFPLRHSLLGHPHSDLAKHYWNLWWVRQMVADGDVPFRTIYLNFPTGLRLYPIEPVNQLASLLLGGVLGLPLLANLLAIGCLVFAATAMYALVRHLTRREGAAIAAGLIYALSSYSVWTVHLGIGELQHMGWVPLSLLWLFKTREDPSWRTALITAALYVVTTLACWYYGFFLYILSALIVVTHPLAKEGGRREHLRLWGRYAAVLLLSLAFVYPIVHLFNRTYRDEPPPEEPLVSWVRHRVVGEPHDTLTGRIDFKVLLRGHPDGYDPAMHDPYTAGGAYLGTYVAIMALLGMVLRPRGGAVWLLAALVGAVLGAGSALVWDGVELQWGSGPHPPLLPFYFINLVLEHRGQPMNFPVRWMAVLTLAATLLAGYFLAWLQDFLGQQRRTRRVAGPLTAAVALLVFIQYKNHGDVRIPFAEHPLPEQPLAERLAREQGMHGVVEIPYTYTDDRRARDAILLMQVVHGKPTASLPIDRISHYVGGERLRLPSSSLARLFVTSATAAPGFVAEEDVAADLQWLFDRGIHWMIIDTGAMTPRGQERTVAVLTGLLGVPLARDEARLLYRLSDLRNAGAAPAPDPAAGRPEEAAPGPAAPAL